MGRYSGFWKLMGWIEMDFYRRVRIVCERIPEGRVATYGQIALLCGKPGGARQVGYSLGHGKSGANLPAHRVVNGKGVLSGAAAFEWPGLQRRLLEAEGIVFEEDGHVDLKKYGWRTVMEDALCFRKQFERLGI